MSKSDLSDRRKARVRLAIRKNAGGRPRLSVFRSSKQIYAQVIDDARGVTVASASTVEKSNREGLKT
ncbi:50S ribosomal protein L18, partial [Salmonella enterica]|nr:50S ribosomal protein L18 [Salmonella enterica]